MDSVDAGVVSVCDRRSGPRLDRGLLRRLAQCGADCLRLVEDRHLERVSIPQEVSVVLLDDEEIARVHAEFMDDPSPTDVISFPYGPHGEILISAETAARQAREYGKSFEEELALYVVHGTLHLCGYEDVSESGRREMAALQERLVAETFGPR